MPIWEIRLHDQPPVILELSDERDLAAEFHELTKKKKRRGKAASESAAEQPSADSPMWLIGPGCTLHRDIIAGVVKRVPRSATQTKKKDPIGFTTPTQN